MPLKSEHFTTPIKLVLPGIIVSVIGLFASNYIFNNPEKNRAKATYATWKVINQFEEMFEENSYALPCSGGDQLQLKQDLVHLLEMSRQSLLDLKSEEKIDKRMSALLNLKIDSYNEMKKITEVFLDSARKTNLLLSEDLITSQKKDSVINELQDNYISDLSHVSNRDTMFTKNILKELNNSYSSYVDSFLIVQKVLSKEEIVKFIIGTWATVDSINVNINIQPGGKGQWIDGIEENNFTWTLQETILTMDLQNGKQKIYQIFKINNSIMSYFYNKDGHDRIATACKL